MRSAAGALVLACLVPASAVAQRGDAWNYRAPTLTRQELEQVLARYEAAAQSPAYSDALKSRVRADADSIRARLRDGDLRIGDRVRLVVESQTALTDTFTVSPGPALVLPGIGSVALRGVLRSEMEGLLAHTVEGVYRGAVVHARLFTRFAVLGGVPRPGFYSLPSEALVEDAISAAGGISSQVSLREAFVERGRAHLYPPDSLQAAMQERRTLSEMGIQDGDRLIVPAPPPPSDPYRAVQVLQAGLTALLTIVSLTRAGVL
jgi:protein involved in polysaccharide export with SLBB domain